MAPKFKSDIEKLIGENLINIIGITIIVIGVAIGAEYSVENELISPLARIIFGYTSGLGLLGAGIILKKKYENYSIVLVCGAMTITYFITYSTYSFFNLIPQVYAFILMAIVTVFTVVVAIIYNRQVIAHIGLAAAYAVPFLLSEGSEKIEILFGYIAIINVGILVISFKKYWILLYYSSFLLTWLLYLLWYESKYQPTEHFEIALFFLYIFFATFYLIFLVYKLLQKEKFAIDDILLLLANSFIFYGIGYNILIHHETGAQFLGLFTICNAIVHFIFSVIIYWQKLANQNLFNLVSGLVFVFITITIPLQLDGNWLTLLLVGETVFLFCIGRAMNIPIYEKLSYPLMLLALFSMVHDWTTVYGNYFPDRPETRITPLFNINFLTSLLFTASFGVINVLYRYKNHPSPSLNQRGFYKIVSFSIPAILLFSLYYSFRMEIATYWDQLYADSAMVINKEGEQFPNHYMNYDLRNFKTIWILNYSLFFFSILAFVNIKKLRIRRLGSINSVINILVIAAFLTHGLYVLSELRESYLEQTLTDYYHSGVFNIEIRYVSFVFVAISLIAGYRYVNQDFMKKDYRIAYDFLLYTSILWIASSEVINWMEINDSIQSYKLELSILWALYSFLLIIVGIWKKKKHLRIGAIALFTVTLVKLFFYDISHLDAIATTIVFISFGILLLIISFLYNKYRHIISD